MQVYPQDSEYHKYSLISLFAPPYLMVNSQIIYFSFSCKQNNRKYISSHKWFIESRIGDCVDRATQSWVQQGVQPLVSSKLMYVNQRILLLLSGEKASEKSLLRWHESWHKAKVKSYLLKCFYCFSSSHRYVKVLLSHKIQRHRDIQLLS